MSLATIISLLGLALSASAVPSPLPSKNGIQKSSDNLRSSLGKHKTGKRGLAYNYNDVALCDMFIGETEITWAYDWSSDSNGLEAGVMYIPTLWGSNSGFTDSWDANAQQAISDGATVLFSFNEPDIVAQSNMSPQDAATAWKQWMEPFAGKASLCAPAVSNGVGTNSGGIPMGFAWIDEFMSACSDCTVDCINVHWYADYTATDYFFDYVNNATSYGKPVYFTEIGATGAPSDAAVSGFLETIMPELDSNSGVAGYAYFDVGDGSLVNGNEPSSYGNVYAKYTG